MAQANDIFGLTASGIPPEMQAEYRGLTRQQAIAEALMKRGMEPGGDVINAGKYLVRRSPLEGIAKIVDAYVGSKRAGEIDAKMGDLGKRYQTGVADAMTQYQTMQKDRPEIPMPSEEAGGGPGRAAIPADRRAAVAFAMTDPYLKGNPLVQSDIASQRALELERAKALLPERPKNQVVGEGGTLVGPDGKPIFSATPRTVPVPAGGSIAVGGKITGTAPAQPMKPGDLASISNAYTSMMKAWDETGNPELLPQIAQLRAQMAQIQSQGSTAATPVQPAPTPIPTPAGFPRVDAATQSGRNAEQVAILQRELANAPPAEQQRIQAEIAKLSTGNPFATAGGDPLKPAAAQDGVTGPLSPKQIREQAGRKTPEQLRAETEAKVTGTETGKARAKASVGLPQIEDSAKYMQKLLDDLAKHSGKPYAVGAGSIAQTWRVPGTPGADFKARLDQVQGGQFLQAYETLKGGGAITDVEGKKATTAISRMSQAQSISEFDAALKEFRGVVDTGLARARAAAGGEQRRRASDNNVMRFDAQGNPIQ